MNYKKLQRVITESKIWKGSQQTSHAFLLSPSVYTITRDQKEQLSKLGFALADCLAGLSHIATIAYDEALNYDRAWGLMRKVFSTGVPKQYLEFQGKNVRHVSKLIKLDLMVNREGQFKIAEIDGHNKHGLGYSTLGKRFRTAIADHHDSLPGVVNILSQEIKRMGYSKITLLYDDRERFYLPEFTIARQEFKKHGISCFVVNEVDVKESQLTKGLFLDLPFMNARPALYDVILPAYRAGKVSFIIPPKPMFGAKGVLALLRNDMNDQHLESILSSFIRKESLDFVRSFIPETYLVGSKAGNMDMLKGKLLFKRYVLKESISSGMKGTVFSDEDDFEGFFKVARQSHLNWILQEEVFNQPQTFEWFEPTDSKPILRTANHWYMRVTVQYVNRQLSDIIVTARRDKAVHGAKDCIQLGTIIV